MATLKVSAIAGGLVALMLSYSAGAQDASPKKPALTSLNPAQQRAALVSGFRKQLDKNHSGFIELEEAPAVITRSGGTTTKSSNGARWINRFDANRDGKVSEDEYVNGVINMTKARCLSGNCPRP